MKHIVSVVGLSCALGLAGCAVTPFSSERVNAPINEQQRDLSIQRSATYIREVTPQEALLRQRISVSGSMSLVDAIKQQLPGLNIQPGDTGVDITRSVNVYANQMPVQRYLDYLSALTGYELSLQENTVFIRAFVTREWNMASFASGRKASMRVGGALSGSSRSGSDLGTTQVSGDLSNDEWEALVQDARDLVASVRSGVDHGSDGIPEPYVHDLRSLGIISAGGPPARMQLLDQYFRNLIKTSHQQVNIAVRAYDVLLKDEKGAGIDWTQMTHLGSLNGNPLDFSLTSGGTLMGEQSGGLLSLTPTFSGGKGGAQATLRFLQTFGDVELLNQPNVTVRNGSYAYFSTGEEMSFIGEIELINDDQDSDTKVGVTIETIEIGVRLAVVPRILDDGRILLDIWPVISSFAGNTEFNVEGIDINRPQISLQELSTEVITETGRPIQLGGFIRRSVAQSLEELPWIEKMTGRLINPLFRHQRNQLDRRELVITVTPTIVEGV